ncbi:MAG: NAD+ synthase [Chthoniobacterales bacterium]|nr:NAD+ synthase [Chthoniobacterales bacterium]
MRLGIAQINPTVGALEQNAELIINAYRELVTAGAELVITPELAITGYPPQDLLFVEHFFERSRAALEEVHRAVGQVPLVVGCLDCNKTGYGKSLYNAAAFLLAGEEPLFVHKRLLPTYDVFEETRYFEPGKKVTVIPFRNHKIGITICEDLWSPDYLPSTLYHIDPPTELVAAGATLLLNISASPFQLGKPAARIEMLRAQAQRLHVPIVYCNTVGGNDQLIFDGHSFVVDAEGALVATLSGYCEEKKVVKLLEPEPVENLPDNDMEELYQALLLGIGDYTKKCGFENVLLGLSGGIDSALVATLAVAALGADAVTGVLMPGPYSSQGSIDDALALVRNLKIKHQIIPITSLCQELQKLMTPSFVGYKQDVTEENIQARLRGMILMSLSNKWHNLLLTTGNKSELAVGYCTLYGDMCGGLAVIADVPKTLVYKLARWINRKQEIIPPDSIEKPPSAELRPDQKDQDSLPPYEVLDAILELVIEKNASVETMVARGFDRKLVTHILQLVDRNEYKRQQAPPGLKVTGKAFSNGRRFPIAQQYV